MRAGEFYCAARAERRRQDHDACAWSRACCAPDAGSISVFGIDALADPVAAKRIMAWVSDEPMIYDKLTPLEYLEFVAGLWGIEPASPKRAPTS